MNTQKMDNQASAPWIRYLFAAGLAVVLVVGGLLALNFWIKPAELNAMAREKLTPISPVAQPLESDSGQANVSAAIQFPIRGAFYYAWYPTAWSQKNRNPFTNYKPSLGFYDSSQPDVIKEHIAEMQYGNIQLGISAWFGQGTDTDKVFPRLLQAAQGTGFRWTIYYEMPGIKDTTVDAFHTDLVYLRDHYASDPSFLKINGRFVVFVYNPASGGCDTISQWAQANRDINAYLVMKVVPNYRSCPVQPDGWHQYAPTKETESQGKYSFSISPGFWQAGDSPRLARDLTAWAKDVQQMVTSGAQFQLITSFNEWGEGTAVESAAEWQTSSDFGAYLDVLHQITGGGSASEVSAKPVPQTGTSPTTVPEQSTQAAALPASPLTAASNPSGDPVLLAAGDISTCSSNGDFATAKILAQYPDATIATLGDTVYEEGTAAQFSQCFNPAWGAFKDRIRPAVGNHEYLTPDASGYFGYFGSSAGDPTKGYYSYDLGTWHVIVINSNCSKIGGCGPGSPQEKWLKADLAAHPAKCTLSYWHHPRWSDGEHGDQVQMATIWTDLYNAGADLVLSGHDHDYERFMPVNADGAADPQNGIREFVVGTGGKNYYPLNSTFAPTSQVHAADVFGILKLVLHPSSYDWQFIPESGKSFTDSGTGQCH